MLKMSGIIDVIIPRGGKSLVEKVQNDARIPVFSHLEGICHIYVDEFANFEKSVSVVVNGKMRRTGICGATESLLINNKIARSFLPIIYSDLKTAGCEMVGDKKSKTIISEMELAKEEDWSTEYLGPKISIKIVDDLNDAIKHIEKFGSQHTDAIMTENKANADFFTKSVDSAIVMVNASTQFADGGEFGLGAEIGISTGRLHARGPVGAEQLTSFKYVVHGNGQIRP
jgi:glutamate-5-semialdehyde dehydrogenase